MKRYRLNKRGKIQLIILLIIVLIISLIHINTVCSNSVKTVYSDSNFDLENIKEYEQSGESAISINFGTEEEKAERNFKKDITSIVEYRRLEVLKSSSAKTYEDYKMITLKTSPQWDMIYNQELFTITDDGFLMTDDGFYAVALGSYFGWCGSKYIMITDEGNKIPVILLDLKKDIHTDENNFAGINNNDVIEFVVDSSKMPKWSNGYCYGGNFNNIEKFRGNIVEIIVIERVDK